MLLGDLIGRLDDDAVASETLLAMGDLGLIAEVRSAAEREGITVGDFLSRAVDRFANGADSDDWLALMSAAGRSDNPGAACLKAVVLFDIRSRSPASSAPVT